MSCGVIDQQRAETMDAWI